MSDEKERKFMLYSPDGKRALKFDSEGVHPLEAAEPGEADVVVETKPLLGPLREITKETRIDGPAKVNSDEYRAGWDRIFGGKQEVGQA